MSNVKLPFKVSCEDHFCDSGSVNVTSEQIWQLGPGLQYAISSPVDELVHTSASCLERRGLLILILPTFCHTLSDVVIGLHAVDFTPEAH